MLEGSSEGRRGGGRRTDARGSVTVLGGRRRRPPQGDRLDQLAWRYCGAPVDGAIACANGLADRRSSRVACSRSGSTDGSHAGDTRGVDEIELGGRPSRKDAHTLTRATCCAGSSSRRFAARVRRRRRSRGAGERRRSDAAADDHAQELSRRRASTCNHGPAMPRAMRWRGARACTRTSQATLPRSRATEGLALTVEAGEPGPVWPRLLKHRHDDPPSHAPRRRDRTALRSATHAALLHRRRDRRAARAHARR